MVFWGTFPIYVLYQIASWKLTGDTFQATFWMFAIFYKPERPGTMRDVFFTLLVAVTWFIIFLNIQHRLFNYY